MMKETTGEHGMVSYLRHRVTHTVYDVKWTLGGTRVAAVGCRARGSGCLQLYKIPASPLHSPSASSLELVCEAEKRSPFKCCTFGASRAADNQIATGDFEGRVAIWDFNNTALPVYSAQAHSSIINCIDGIGGDIGKGAPEIVTGSRDGRICVWDPRSKTHVLEIKNPTRDCWSVCFGDAHSTSSRCICAGFDNGELLVFDMCASRTIWRGSAGAGVCSVCYDRADSLANNIFVATLSAQLRIYDVTSMHPTRGYNYLDTPAHGISTVWCVKPLPQNPAFFASTGGDGRIQLFKHKYPPTKKETDPAITPSKEGTPVIETVASLAASSQPVVSYDWNRGHCGLFAAAVLDQSILIGFTTKLEE